MRRAGIVLDRDGTIVDHHRDAELGVIEAAFHPSQLRFLPGAIEGLEKLAKAGVPLAIATNQPGAAKGQYPASAIERTNGALVEMLKARGIAIARVETCLHHPEHGPACACRKPAPGMLIAIAEALDLDVGASFMIGDSAADVGAAKAAGMRSALLADPRRCELCPLRDIASELKPDLAAPRLDRLADLVLVALGLQGS